MRIPVHRRMPVIAVAAPHDRAARAPFLLGAGLIAVVGIAVYLTSLSGAFVFDDHEHIVNNPLIRRLWPIGSLLAGTARPIVYLTLAIDYALGGLDVRGFHAVNLAIHVLAALALYAILVRTFNTPRLRDSCGPSAIRLAVAAALIWVAHPLQTEAVTYIIQRGESLAGLFYLLTLLAVIRGDASARHCGRWYAAAVVGCALGMATKAVMVTAPLVILIFDRMFLTGSWRDLFARRRGMYAGLAATWSIAAYLTTVDPNPTAGFGMPMISPAAYASSQPGVVLHYLRLAIWPSPLVFDYGWPIAAGARAIALPAAAIIGMVAATLWAVARGIPAGFLGVWFFLILAPSSSVIPIKDLAFEHRMYLSLAAVAVLWVIALEWALRRWNSISSSTRLALAAALCAGVVVSLGVATARRNLAYRSEISIWSDVLSKRPENPRGYYALGGALVVEGDDARAIPLLAEALRRQPTNPLALSNLAVAELRLGRPELALARLDQVIRVDPARGRAPFMHALISQAYYNRGLALDELRRYPEAIASYREAGRLVQGDLALPVERRIAEALLAQLDHQVTRFFLALSQAGQPRGVRFEELPARTAAPPATFDKTYARIMAGKRVGQVRVLIDLTRRDARVHFEVGGEVPRDLLHELAGTVTAVMTQSGAEPLARPPASAPS